MVESIRIVSFTFLVFCMPDSCYYIINRAIHNILFMVTFGVNLGEIWEIP